MSSIITNSYIAKKIIQRKMANWCLNEITIKGEKSHLDKLKKKINDYITLSEKGNKIYFMEYLIGLGKVPADYNKNPEEYKKKWFGTRCDMELTELKFSINDESIHIDTESLWSPVIPFVSKLCLKYEVEITMEYYEYQGDFGGRAIVDTSGRIDHEEWSYLNALYLYRNSAFWQEFNYHEKNMTSENFLDFLSDQTYLSKKEISEIMIRHNMKKYNL